MHDIFTDPLEEQPSEDLLEGLRKIYEAKGVTIPEDELYAKVETYRYLTNIFMDLYMREKGLDHIPELMGKKEW
jgi:hypothetical protein